MVLVAARTSRPAPTADGDSSTHARTNRVCGVERWAVKTLADRRARLVNLKPRTTIRALRRLRRPAEPTGRVRGVETKTYRVRARVLAAKIEEDSDIHLVI